MLCFFALNTLLRRLSSFLLKRKTEHIIRVNIVFYLVNDDKMHICTKQWSFINMLHNNNTRGSELSHDS